MMLPSRSLGWLRRRALAAALAGLLTTVANAPAQMRWSVDPKASLAWWQMSPHLNHLWATTCPGEPSWRAGEGRNGGGTAGSYGALSRTGYGAVDDTVHVPLFPRQRVHLGCMEAVRGEVVVADTMHWRGVRGTVIVRGDAVVTGQTMRDVAMHQIMETGRYPEIHFTLDSLVGMTKQADTLRGSAVGTLTVRVVQMPVIAELKVFPDAGGMRVLAKWRIPAVDLQLQLVPRLHYLALGVNTMIWHDFFMGADLVLRPEAAGAN
jgi:YceI-like protein